MNYSNTHCRHCLNQGQQGAELVVRKVQAIKRSKLDVGGMAASDEGLDAAAHTELQAAIAASLADVPLAARMSRGKRVHIATYGSLCRQPNHSSHHAALNRSDDTLVTEVWCTSMVMSALPDD